MKGIPWRDPMHLRTHVAFLCGLALLSVLFLAPNAAATTTTVTTNPFSTSGTLTTGEIWDSFELTASSGSRVTYTVTPASGDCVMVLFAKGHSVTMSSTYYVSYSQATCAASYTNTFPVGSSDGTDFSVVVSSTMTTDVPYTVSISVSSPGALGAVLWILIFAVIGAVVGLVAFVVRKRKKVVSVPPPYIPAYNPSMMPPSYAPPTQAPLPQSPDQPPSNPGTPP